MGAHEAVADGGDHEAQAAVCSTRWKHPTFGRFGEKAGASGKRECKSEAAGGSPLMPCPPSPEAARSSRRSSSSRPLSPAHSHRLRRGGGVWGGGGGEGGVQRGGQREKREGSGNSARPHGAGSCGPAPAATAAQHLEQRRKLAEQTQRLSGTSRQLLVELTA